MTWPKRYGGGERSALERYVLLEELLAAGAPVGAHWIADRQSGPALLRYGSEKQRDRFLPAITRGECFFCIGMSEPNAGSDLASVRTRGVQDRQGLAHQRAEGLDDACAARAHDDRAGAHRATAPKRHEGLSQFLIDLRTPGITVRPIVDLVGDVHFNEVFFDDVLVPDDMLLGVEGQGWQQVHQRAVARAQRARALSVELRAVRRARARCGRRRLGSAARCDRPHGGGAVDAAPDVAVGRGAARRRPRSDGRSGGRQGPRQQLRAGRCRAACRRLGDVDFGSDASRARARARRAACRRRRRSRCAAARAKSCAASSRAGWGCDERRRRAQHDARRQRRPATARCEAVQSRVSEGWNAELWSQVDEMGLPLLLVPEDRRRHRRPIGTTRTSCMHAIGASRSRLAGRRSDARRGGCSRSRRSTRRKA